MRSPGTRGDAAAELRWLWERASDPVVVFDEWLQPVYVNDAYSAAFGAPVTESFMPNLDAHSRALLGLYGRRLLRNGVKVGEITLQEREPDRPALTARLARVTLEGDRFLVALMTRTEGGGDDRTRLEELERAVQLISETLGTVTENGGSSGNGDERAWSTLEGLSPRELEVVALVRAGAGGPEVAAALHVSQHTARNHLKSIYRKLGVHSRAELVSLLENAPGGQGS